MQILNVAGNQPKCALFIIDAFKGKTCKDFGSTCTKTAFSINLDRNFKFDIGQKLLNCSKSAFTFLRRGNSSAILSSLGSTPDDNDRLIALLNTEKKTRIAFPHDTR